MGKENYSKYALIKAILLSNLEEEMKEAIVKEIIGAPQPIWFSSTTTDNGCTIRHLANTGA